MKVTYVARTFLDYRIPVFREIWRQLDGRFTLVYSVPNVPDRVHEKIQAAIGDSAVGLTGEYRIGAMEYEGFANRQFRLVYQPGLLGTLRRSRPDVVVGDGFYQWTGAVVMHRILSGTPMVICYERTAHTERAAQRIRVAYRRWVIRYTASMACNGRLSREYASSLGMPGDRITVGQMAADSHELSAAAASVTSAERASVRSEWGSPDTVLLTVGQLIVRKGIGPLLESWRLLEQREPGNRRLLIAGDGPERRVLERKAAAYGLNDVIFLGHVEYDQIARLYACVDALVMPTLEDNWSLVVPEAMACRLPVLCSVYNGCHPELVMPGVNGWTFDPEDPEDGYRNLLKMVEAGPELAKMGAQSARIVADYSPERAAASILDACRGAVPDSRLLRSDKST